MKRHITKVLVVMALVICMSAALPGLNAFAVTVNDLTVNVDPGHITLYQSDDIANCAQTSGTCPPGMQLTYAPDTAVYLKNAPTATGTYNFSCTVTKADGSTESFDVTVVVAEKDKVIYEGDEYLPVSTPVPTAKPTQTAPNITKHPTGETVEVGDAAKFVSRADNFTKRTWRLVSADTTCTYKATEADYYFPGLEVSGTDSDTLILSNIPASLSGWCVECKFENDYGASYSNGARITVNGATPAATATPKPTATPKATAAPSTTGGNNTGTAADNTPADPNVKTANITTQPKSTKAEKGDNVTLSVYATSPDNGDVSYQWYSASVNDRNAALPISGATEDTYTVTPTEDAVYYWAAVWNTKEGKRSEAVYTQAAEVMLIPEATPTPSPTPVPTPTDDGGSFAGGNFQLILFAVIGLLALAALIGVVIYLRIESKREDE